MTGSSLVAVWAEALTALSFGNLAWGSLALLVTYFASWVVYVLFFHPLSGYPGPKLAAITPLTHIIWDITGTQHSMLLSLHNKYGDVVRIAPNALAYRAASGWKDIYGHRKKGQKVFRKDPALYTPTPNGVDAIITAQEDAHSRMRRLLTHAFSNKALKAQEEILQRYADMLTERLKDVIGSHRSQRIDMVRWFNFTTFDLIGDLAFGEPFGGLSTSKYHWWVKCILDAVKASAYLKIFWFYPFLLPMIKYVIPRHLMEMREQSFKFTVERVRTRLARGTSRPDFTSYILKHTKEGIGMSTEEMDANAAVFVLAGSETTAALLSGAVYYLARHMDKYDRLVKEIRGTFSKQTDITLAALFELPYLNAVLMESMRIYPPIPSMLPRIVPEGGAIINDRFVPEKTSVSMSPYSTFHSAAHFKYPDTFIPERWLLESDEFKDDNKEVFQPYSWGPRNCLGQHLANAEMRLIIAKLFWNFDIDLPAESRDWVNQKSFSLWRRPELMVNISRANTGRS